MDLAQIGFAVETSGLDQALPSLQRLVPASKAVETGANSAAAAITKVGAAAQGVVAPATAMGRTIAAAGAEFNTTAANTNKAAAGLEALQAKIQKVVNAYAGIKIADPFASASRAEDIAAYGKSLDALRAKYDPLFAASQQYKAALGEINNALKVGAMNTRQHAAAITDTKVAFTQQVNSIRGVTEQFDAFNKQSGKTRAAYQGLSHDAKNLSYQLVDVTQGVIMGQGLFQIFAQQAGQIGQVLATTEKGAKGLFKEVGSAIAAVLTPLRLAVLGFLALGAAMLFSIASTINSSKALDDLSKSIDVSVAKLHGLQQAAGFKDISTEEFAAGMTQFATSVDDAKHNVGSLNGLMIASGKSAKDFNGYLMNVADIVARTTSGVQKRNILEAAGLPTTQAWVKLMSQGRTGIEAAIAESVKFNASAEANLVQKARDFDNAWNKYTTKFGQYFKSAVVEAMGWLDKLNQAAMFGLAAAGAVVAVITAPFSLIAATLLAVAAAITAGVAALKGTGAATDAAANGKPPKRIEITGGTTMPDQQTQAQLLAANFQAQQRISLLGEMATVEQRVTATQLSLNAAGLQGVGVGNEMNKKILNATRAQEENNRVNAQASIGIFNIRDANKAAADTLQMWIDKGLVDKTNTEQMAAAKLVLARNIEATGNAAAVAAAPLQALKQLELDAGNFAKVLDQGLTSSLNGLVSPLQDVLNGVTSLGDGFKNIGVIVLKAIQEMIIKMLVLAPIAAALRAIFAGFTGGASEAVSLAGGMIPLAKGGVFANDNISSFAKGGSFTNSIVTNPTLFKYANGGKFGEMGEAGPEAVVPLKRGPDGSLGVQMYGKQSNDSGGGTTVMQDNRVFHLGGTATQGDIAELKKAMRDESASFQSRVGASVQKLRKRNYGV